MSTLFTGADDAAEARASLILHDLKVVTGRALSLDGRPPFDWLEPGYSNKVYLPTAERLAAGLASTPPNERSVTAAGIRRALATAATQWVGASVSLALLDWAWESVRELLNPSLLLGFVTHHNPNDAAESAFWLKELTRRWNTWQLQPSELRNSSRHISAEQWAVIALRSTETDRPAVTCWLLSLVDGDKDAAQFIRKRAYSELRAKLPALPPGIDNWWEEAEVPAARLCGHDAEYGFDNDLIRSSESAALQRFIGQTACDWPRTDGAEQEVTT